MSETMKTKKRGFIRRGFKAAFNVRHWVAYDEAKASGKSIFSLLKSFFVPQKATHYETFAEAVERLQLSEKDIIERQKGFLTLAIIYLILALGLFIYTLYVLFSGHAISAFLCLILTLLVLIYAYREHFWYTQVKNRKLGVTFKEWLALTFKIKVKS